MKKMNEINKRNVVCEIKDTEAKVNQINDKINSINKEVENVRNTLDKVDAVLNEIRTNKIEKIELELENIKSKEAENVNVESVRAMPTKTAAPHFNPNNISEKSNLTKADADKMLKDSKLKSVSGQYIEAEEKYGVNAVFLMALTSLESGHGKSNVAINNNNIGGVRRGGEYINFSSWGSCIDYIANLLSKYYLKEDAKYFNGYSAWDVNKNYCENSDWADKIVAIANGLMSNL